MKKLFFLLFISFYNQYQSQEFNRWSIGANIGAHDGVHFSGIGMTKILSIHHFSVNGRYMHSNRFGWKINTDYDFFKWKNLDNPTKYIRFSIEAVFNFTDILHYDDFTNRFGLQAHSGFGYSRMWNKYGLSTSASGVPLIENGPFDNMIHGVIGVTPIFKLNEKINLNIDLSYIFHLRQERTFDFRQHVPSIGGFLGSFYNLSFGATYYIGKKARHADWIYSKKITDDRILALKSQYSETKIGLEDDDRDGVINALDEEPNTTLGSIVNNKGISDSLFNGINALSSEDIRKQLQFTKNYISDDDVDGVINGVDEEKNTPLGSVVNAKGIRIEDNNLSNLNLTQPENNIEIEMLKKELNDLKNKLNDDDKDGVINFYDEENNTTLGASVDSKGKAIIEKIELLGDEEKDSDKDGVNDKFDLCPMLAGKSKGCPDADNDDVPDILDACPSQKGVAKFNGCPDEQAKLVTLFNDMTAYDVFFTLGSSKIEPTYKLILDKLAKLMTAEPSIRINAVGHTDKNGSDDVNLKLSKERVTNCIKYITSKGISIDRFNVNYIGSKEAIVINGNMETNSINRRVTFSVEK
jgi:OOP family OmpA-OmpF porin